MAEPGPRGHRPDEQAPPVVPPAAEVGAAPSAGSTKLSPAELRALKFTARNMLWSLLPLTVLVVVMVWWTQLRQPDQVVRPVEIDGSVFLASQRAAYPLLIPQGLSDGWQPTSVRTDAGAAADPGDPVTLQIGWYTPDGEYAGYVVSDDAEVDALTDVLGDATADGTAQVDGVPWQRLTTGRGETALTRTEGTVTLLVTGSAVEEELEELAGAVSPYRAS
ncbi:Protein of unknown function [Modestobacter sp. DSM 44400]|uniref:DUF4245 domain-containing protein n=1 Tax=Modestobacter sp. DSM 44400 TaxID=1550230 RepID=UPI00089A6397|nr:DUF4245 domain-containing protein [Modestobacter sp. DSM 44400]SDX88196.1 Protein of unknown function [Modestobacter sp. DSM 44400]